MAQTLFAGQTPAVAGGDGAPGITTATTIRSTVDGTATAIRFYTGPTVGGTYTGLLWERLTNDTGGAGTGDLLASEAYVGTPATSAWNEIALDPPIPIVAGVTYRVGIHNPTRYVATNNFFTTELVNGDLVADENGDTAHHLGLIRQGSFVINASPSYPTQVGSSASYFVDIVFEPESEEEPDRFTSGTAALSLAASGAVATARESAGTLALTASASAAVLTARTTAGVAALVAGATAGLSSARTTAGTARLTIGASALQVRGGGGPRLVTVTRRSRLTSVARPDAITTTTRG